jgi:hypothetical protein
VRRVERALRLKDVEIVGVALLVACAREHFGTLEVLRGIRQRLVSRSLLGIADERVFDLGERVEDGLLIGEERLFFLGVTRLDISANPDRPRRLDSASSDRPSTSGLLRQKNRWC